MRRRRLAYAAAGAGVAAAVGGVLHLTLGGEDEPRIAFLGVWDRAVPGLQAASEETGHPVAFLRPGQVVDADEGSLAAYDVIFVLNFLPEQAPALVRRLERAREINARQKVIVLDERDTHPPLHKAKVLREDEQARRYWRYGGRQNFERLLVYTAVRHLGESGEVRPPMVVPEDGLYHPDADDLFSKVPEYEAWYRRSGKATRGGPTAVFLVHQSFVILDDTRVVDAIVRAFESRGVNVVTVFASHEDRARALVTSFDPDMVMTQRHTALGRSAEGGPLLPQELDIPYLKPISMLRSTVEEWRASPRGLHPSDVGSQIILQELDGVIEPIVVGGLVADTAGYRIHEPIPERVDRFVGRAKR